MISDEIEQNIKKPSFKPLLENGIINHFRFMSKII